MVVTTANHFCVPPHPTVFSLLFAAKRFVLPLRSCVFHHYPSVVSSTELAQLEDPINYKDLSFVVNKDTTNSHKHEKDDNDGTGTDNRIAGKLEIVSEEAT